MAKRTFTIDIGAEQIVVEGNEHKNVAVKYLMKRRRSLLSTKDPIKVESLYAELPQQIRIVGKQLTKGYAVNWERVGTEEYAGARFAFTLNETK